MMKYDARRGVTLIEMLVVIAVLTIIMAGIYGLLTSAYLTYNQGRAKLESQQTARSLMDYLVYRLREVDGGKATANPWNCTDCHVANMDNSTGDNALIPCVKDVSVPQRMPDILAYQKRTMPTLAGVPNEFQNLTGYNYIQFKADLLPVNGFNEAFTDGNMNSKWDWTAYNPTYDRNMNGKYDAGDVELLDDMNSNGIFDYFGETWTFQLHTTNTGPYFQLVESLNFTSLQPRAALTKKANGKLRWDNSPYPASGYVNLPVGYGVTGLGITKVPRVFKNGTSIIAACIQGRTAATARLCHGAAAVSKAGTVLGPLYNRALNVYGNATSMDFAQFNATHPFWNTQGLSIEICTMDTKGRSQQYTRLRQFVNFRNLEVNQ